MRKLIVRGDPGIRRDAVVEYGGEKLRVFAVQRQGAFHGPDEPQLWCTVGTEDEREQFEKRQFVPHWLDVESVDAEALTIRKSGGDLNV